MRETQAARKTDGTAEIIIHSTAYMNGRATTRGVFKAHAFFLEENKRQIDLL